MKPERWQQVDRLFQAALECEPEERAAFISEACGGDDSLRHEVEALLAADGQAGSLIEAPAYAVGAPLIAGDDAQLLVGKSIGHFQIISLVGKGGMGEVYRARDTKLDRTVALKILPEELAADAERMRRFVREAKAVSGLNHSNVAHIYEIGECDGVSFIAMEFVQGQTLAAKINGHPLETDEIVEIASQIADALDEAHSKGITHRDIKPANVMLTSRGQVKVLDFGLAKIDKPRNVDSNVSTLVPTAPGVVLGTVPYMSPEQSLGHEVDHRSDLFSLGVVLYEMATGRLPFAGANTSETLNRILHSQPEAMARFNYEVPAELERMVRKCLEKERERRYQWARELLVDLKNLKRDGHSGTTVGAEPGGERQQTRRTRWALLAAVLGALVVVLFAYALYANREPPALQPEIQSLAVLPLVNLSGDPAQEYFADGMTEALISNLTQVRALRVISRTSVMRFKGSRKPLAEIAQELNVDAVIEGSVQRDGRRVRITARLVRVANDSPLRSFDYERELTDVLKLQSEVARAVADETRIQVTTEERARLATARTVRPEAYEEYLLGRHYLPRHDEENLKLSISHFERAVQRDANYAAAWAGLSRAWQERGIFGGRTLQEVEPPARNAAKEAIRLDNYSAEAYTSLANLKFAFDWDWAGAEKDFRLAIALDPGNDEAHISFAFLLGALGRHAEAINEAQTAERLDPLSARMQDDFGRILYRARKYEEAEWRTKRAFELGGGNYGRLADIYALTGRYTDAIASLEENGARLTGATLSNNSLHRARVYARMGKRDEALRLLNDAQRTTEPARFSKLRAAAVWTALGDKDQAFRLIFTAVKERSDLSVFLKVDPNFDDLHSDPRWKEFLRRMRFPEE